MHPTTNRSLAPTASSQSIHVVLGDVAANTFRVAFPETTCFVDQDVLSCGPTPHCDDLQEWRAMRTRYWRDHVPDLINEHVPSPDNVLEHLIELRSAERVIVWTATGVSEQLFLAFMCQLLRSEEVNPDRIELVRFETNPVSGAPVAGLGELDVAALHAHPQLTPLTGSLMQDYLDAWNAVSADEPLLLERFETEHAAANEPLKRAMRIMLRRYPGIASGLSDWDLQLLECVRSHGSKVARVIGYAMNAGWDEGDLVGDWYLYGRLLRLGDARLPQPLVELSGDSKNMRQTSVSLTSFGNAVLNGLESNLAVNPIDEWTGGVHLSTANGNVWVRDGERVVKV